MVGWDEVVVVVVVVVVVMIDEMEKDECRSSLGSA
jgi:hypothetical protein